MDMLGEYVMGRLGVYSVLFMGLINATPAVRPASMPDRIILYRL